MLKNTHPRPAAQTQHPLRKCSARYGSRWLAYGKRRVGSKIIDHKGELRTVATIKQMYAEGVSIATIARCLDTMKIPTRRQGKGWDYHTVTAILNREGVYAKGRKDQVRAVLSA